MAITDVLIDAALQAASHPRVSRFVGQCADLELPPAVMRAVIRSYVRAWNVDLTEIAEPLESFRTFDAFFTRRLRPGARTVTPGPTTLVSPVDGRLVAHGTIERGELLQVKGVTYTVEALLDDPDAARRFHGGTYFTLYLSPRDYHRIHCPIDGEVLGYRYVPGRLFPVNRIGLEHVQGLFWRNERITTYLRTAIGQVAVVKVGATSVGRITVSYADVRTNDGVAEPQAIYYARPKAINKGSELGVFHLGSTVVLLVEPPAVGLDPTLAEGRAMRMGEVLARR